MHCRSLRVRFILSIYFEVVWQQFGVISVLFKNPVNLNAFHCLLVVQLDTLCFFFIPNIVEVHELLLHLRCTITVNHLFKLKLGMILERATSNANLAHVVIILVIVRPLLVPQERWDSLTLSQAHANCRLPLITFTIQPNFNILGLQGVNFGSRLRAFRKNRHFSCHGGFLGLLPYFDCFMALVGFHCLVKDLLLSIKSPTDLSLDLRQGQFLFILVGLDDKLIDHSRCDTVNPSSQVPLFG